MFSIISPPIKEQEKKGKKNLFQINVALSYLKVKSKLEEQRGYKIVAVMSH